MPRLLSNKSPNKISRKPVEKFEEHKQKESLWPDKDMTAWEYYNHLMKSGKRKMTRDEWLVWSLKKSQEDVKKGKCIRLASGGVMTSTEYNYRLKKDPNFVDKIAREEFALGFKKDRFLS